jgi:hypothetical protein
MKQAVEFNLRVVTREERESSRSDANRFQLPDDYIDKHSLQYFRDDFNRQLFLEWFYYEQVLSNHSLLRLAEVSSPFVTLDRKVCKPLFQVYDMHRDKYIELGRREYNLDERTCCRLYHLTFSLMAAMVKLNQLDTSSDNLNEYFNETLREKMSGHE